VHTYTQSTDYSTWTMDREILNEIGKNASRICILGGPQLCRPSGCIVWSWSWLLLEQCRRASAINVAHRSHSVVTVTSSRLDDVIYDATDDEDDDPEQSGSGEGARRHWPRVAVVPDRATRRTPLSLSVHRFRQASDVDVVMTTRRTAAASSSTSRRSMTSLVTSSLLAQLTFTILRTRYLVFVSKVQLWANQLP